MRAKTEGKGILGRALRLESWSGCLLAALLFLLLLALLYPEALFQGKVFVSPDSLAPRGFAEYVAGQEGGSSLWNPFIFSGMPAFSSLSYNPGLYIVGTGLRFVIDSLGAPPLSWLLFHYLWVGLGIFLFLRYRGVRGWPAFLAGAWFIALPAQVAIGAYGHGSKVMTLSWLPWILLFVDRLVAWRRPLLDASLLGLSLACLLLTAHIQVVYYGLLLGAAFAVFRLIGRGREVGWARAAGPLLLGVLALLLAMGCAALLYGPVHEYSAQSIRGVGVGGGAAYDYATAWSLAPSEWITFLLPSSRGFGEETYFGRMPMTNYPNYLGVLPLLAALLLFIKGPRRSFDIFFACVFVFATLVAAGKYFPLLYKPLYNLLPYFNRFRVPVMILLLQQLSLAFLFARGLERALADKAYRARLRLLTMIGLLFLLAVVLIGPSLLETAAKDGLREKYAPQLARVSSTQARTFVTELARQSASSLRGEALRAGGLLLLFAAALELRRRRPAFRHGAALVMLTAILALLVDLLPLDGKVLHPARHWEHRAGVELWGDDESPSSMLPPGTLAFLRESLEGQRFYAMPGSAFQGNEAAAEGLASFGGYHAAKLALADSVLKALPRGGASLLGRFAVRFVVSPRAGDLGSDFRQVSGADEFVHENRLARPRLFLQDEAIRVEPPARSRERLMQGRALGGELYLNAAPAFLSLAAERGEGAPGKIAAIDWGLDRVACSVDLTRPAVLVLADMAYPGWLARVDGAELPLLTADGFFRALELGSGAHEVEFVFAPESMDNFVIWRRASFGGLLLLLLTGLLASRRPQKRDELMVDAKLQQGG